MNFNRLKWKNKITNDRQSLVNKLNKNSIDISKKSITPLKNKNRNSQNYTNIKEIKNNTHTFEKNISLIKSLKKDTYSRENILKSNLLFKEEKIKNNIKKLEDENNILNNKLDKIKKKLNVFENNYKKEEKEILNIFIDIIIKKKINIDSLLKYEDKTLLSKSIDKNKKSTTSKSPLKYKFSLNKENINKNYNEDFHISLDNNYNSMNRCIEIINNF